MRILHYNILDGCGNDPDRLARVQRWVKKQGADVAGLCELNGWDGEPGMVAHAAACGFEYSHLLVGHSPYRIGLMAHEPIELIDQISSIVHHGILHVRIAGIHFLYSHFSPHERLVRIHEARLIAQIAGRVAEPLVLMGDLNSHSPRDRELCETFATEKNREWALDFEPQQIILDAGLIDISDRSEKRGTLNTNYHATGGTRWIDYIYVNPAFQARFPNGRAQVIRTPETANLSDHLPLICDTGS